MLNKLNSVLASSATFSEQQLNQIHSCFKPLSVKRNEILLRGGEVCGAFYFVSGGCLRIYFINKEGTEKTRQVILDGEFGSALTSFITQKPGFEINFDRMAFREKLNITADYALYIETPE
jgi:hypothetical protein